jgi:hypothetical protein
VEGVERGWKGSDRRWRSGCLKAMAVLAHRQVGQVENVPASTWQRGEQLEDESGLLAATRQTLAVSRVSSWLAAMVLLASHSYCRLCASCLYLLPLRVYLCVGMAKCCVIASCPASPVHPLSAVLMRCAPTTQ